MAGDEQAGIWMRAVTAGTPPGPKRTFSRTQITEAAVRIADTEGLEAASMRQIAAALGTGPMSLYRYVASRDDLVELMIDHVAGEMDLPATPGGGWRAALRRYGRQKRLLWQRHPWLAACIQGHPVWGPNSLAEQEFVLAAVDGFGLSADEMLALAGLVTGYAESFARAEVGWAQEIRRTGVDMPEWIRRTAPYARQIAAEGRYPTFTRVILQTRTPFLEPDARFEYGLDRVLDAVAATLGERSPSAGHSPGA